MLMFSEAALHLQLNVRHFKKAIRNKTYNK